MNKAIVGAFKEGGRGCTLKTLKSYLIEIVYFRKVMNAEGEFFYGICFTYNKSYTKKFCTFFCIK